SMGADGFQRYPGADGSLLGKGSLKDSFILGNLLTTIPPGTLLIAAHHSPTLNQVFLHAFALARNTSPQLGGLHLIRLGEAVPPLAELPNPGICRDLDGPVELVLPLLLGAVFSLIE
ncbi:MAG TPA: hypothetical protein PLS90_09350, partial [Candidatus Sumerlaeota bacterium]|nr:hypothetical protein [Candidatus Sumerlaeota bacterium]